MLDARMHRYAVRPMDFADAMLAHVAEREGLRAILTVDHRDFPTYRIGRRAKFRILPAR
jgi:predicted nucleic acid-binding protein